MRSSAPAGNGLDVKHHWASTAPPSATKEIIMKKAIPFQIFESRREFDVSKHDLNSALQFATQKLKSQNLSIEEVLPNFEAGFKELQRKLEQSSVDIDREDMPVVKPENMDDFYQDLKQGRIDIFPPYTKGEKWMPDNFQSKAEKDEWIELGWKDGEKRDDVVIGKWTSIPTKLLKPVQDQIWLDIIIRNAIEYPNLKKLAEKTIIASRDNYIIDGHHRYATLLLYDPNIKIWSLQIPLNIELLIKVARSYGEFVGNVRKR